MLSEADNWGNETIEVASKSRVALFAQIVPGLQTAHFVAFNGLVS
jgi:hypothetical protein